MRRIPLIAAVGLTAAAVTDTAIGVVAAATDRPSGVVTFWLVTAAMTAVTARYLWGLTWRPAPISRRRSVTACDRCKTVAGEIRTVRLVLNHPNPSSGRLKPAELGGMVMDLCGACCGAVWGAAAAAARSVCEENPATNVLPAAAV